MTDWLSNPWDPDNSVWVDPDNSDALADGAAGGAPAVAVSPFTSPKLDAAVDAFKAVFNTNMDYVTFGQFHVRAVLQIEAKKIVDSELAANPDKTLDSAAEKLKTSIDNIDPSIDKSLLTAINEKGLQSKFPGTISLFDEAPGDFMSLYHAVWDSADVVARPTVSKPTIGMIRAASEFENTKCFDSTNNMVRKIVKARSIPSVPSNLAVTQDFKGAKRNSTNHGEKVECDKAMLALAVRRMKKLLDGGFLVRCGALSGLTFDSSAKPWPEPEHYVLVFAHDENAFVFWDSDCEVSNVKSKSWGQGFGALVYTDDRLGTSLDDVDFQMMDSQGNHRLERDRHRYQIHNIQSLPM